MRRLEMGRKTDLICDQMKLISELRQSERRLEAKLKDQNWVATEQVKALKKENVDLASSLEWHQKEAIGLHGMIRQKDTYIESLERQLSNYEGVVEQLTEQLDDREDALHMERVRGLRDRLGMS
ncbi:MAG: hypothetical protein ACR2PH_16535 [Desulfobulbia bacterium]